MSCCGCFHALCSYAFATNILTWILANRFHKNSWQQQGEHEHVYVLLNFFCFWRFYHTFHNIMFCLKLDIYKSEYQKCPNVKIPSCTVHKCGMNLMCELISYACSGLCSVCCFNASFLVNFFSQYSQESKF